MRNSVRETPEEFNELQALLDDSLSRSAAHLRSIINTERTLTAQQLTQVLTGMCTLALSTVTAKGEPRISGVDGHFLHGKWHFGTARGAAKARHLAARSAVSAAHMRGEDLGVFTHGRVETLNPRDSEPAAAWPELLGYLKDFYGDDFFDWDNDVVYYRLHPHWMTVFAPDTAKLTAARCERVNKG
ncbi:pyridoxamine 5'-phosphate oxidase family protein [Micromonospora ureilytica]|uniref:pyridoxamine 5'-phosphate oxidase family protein n=1 Tax=Micromonospora ureilytica TaxID=709868 RepID=UPI00403A6FAA